MKDNNNNSNNNDGGFVRADQIDLKTLDEQLERHLSRAWTMEKNKNKKQQENPEFEESVTPAVTAGGGGGTKKKEQSPPPRQEWEIDPSKLLIKGILARGTFGTVHRGIYDTIDVAVKLLDWGEEGHRTEAEIQSLRAAFTQEVAVWHKLEHPNVTKFIGATMGSSELNVQTENGQIGMPSNICCVVVEYLPGGALKNYLIKNRRKKLAFKVVVQMALDLARGTVKIADFGVARVEASNPNDMTGETGTLGYMAPEVLNGNPYNRKCDVYSFGICLWEIYCCDMPYPDLSFSEVTSAVVRQNLRPEIPRCCPSSLANVMKRCWDANPDKRPEMDEVVKMLEAIDTSKGGGMIPGDQPRSCLCFRKRRGP
uniref:serine/threonine-protein kinase STY13-like isoform X2 n=1 Tax=Erigeron canadensis TaxID=72917 RepID=UPI001CB8CF56|nr:serine/threonine-protein kinase STY13-like isoform X2 [Erigeron canadensis]